MVYFNKEYFYNIMFLENELLYKFLHNHMTSQYKNPIF